MMERNGTSARRAPASGSAAVGLGLIVFGAILGGLILLWALASLVQGQLTAGGFFFGLILLALLCLPLVGAGWYIRGRGSAESAEMASFAARQAVLDNDRVVRRQLARDLDQRAVALLQAADGLPPAEASLVQAAARRLREVVQEVSRPGYDATTWLSETAPNLEAAGIQAIHRYDDLVLAEAQRLESLEAELRRHAAASAPAGTSTAAAEAHGAAQSLVQGVDQLAAHVRERESLLGLGRQAAAMSPQALLAAGAAPRQQLATPGELHLNDAISYLGSDYLVRALLTYFAGGRTWTAYQLHDGRQERWLEARTGGTELGWYELQSPAPVADTSAETVSLEGTTFHRQESGAATVSVESAAGRQDGVFVEYARYVTESEALPRRLLVERWPDGVRTLVGEPVDVADLQFWSRPPAALPGT